MKHKNFKVTLFDEELDTLEKVLTAHNNIEPKGYFGAKDIVSVATKIGLKKMLAVIETAENNRKITGEIE